MKGVPFRSHLHVPEVHPLTGMMFCEREDEGHVLKVLTVQYHLIMLCVESNYFFACDCVQYPCSEILSL